MEKIKAIVVGCGDRATVYCEEAVNQLRRMEVVAAIDPDPERLRYIREHFGVKEEQCYTDMQDVLSQGRIADCVINGTMDQLHMKTCIPFLEQGYHMLLEKPIVNNKEDLLTIRDTAKANNCKMMICHVLRYAPFYRKIKALILDGAIGEIMNIQMTERVGAFHSSVAFIRGKWASEAECGSPLLLAKCCHDIDLICWLNNSTVPESVFSHGGRNYFLPEKAPEGAGTMCLVDCPQEVRDKCVYDVQSMYLDNCSLSTTSATTIFTMMTLAQSAAPYINMGLIYGNLLKKNMNRMLIVMFTSSAISFAMMYAVSNTVVNIVFLFLAVLAANGASSVLWNAYCPSLKDTGMVSTATGYLDFLSYAAAALANQLFANAVSDIGWGNLILVWGALMLAGVLVAVPIRKK